MEAVAAVDRTRGRRSMCIKSITVALAWVLLLCLWPHISRAAEWETGVRTGFDTNIDRAISAEKSDSYLSVYLSLGRESKGESRLNWMFSASIDGTVYHRLSELNGAEITVSPGLVYFPYRALSLTVSPFFQAKTLKDSDQSAVTAGAKVILKEPLGKTAYMGQYYLFKASSANADTYSFTENGVGFFAGMKLKRSVACEIGYEFSYGDSFRAISSTSTTAGGGGRGRGRGRDLRYSTAFGEFVIREPVDRHTAGLNLGIDWTRSLFSTMGYVYTAMNGDSGTSISHSGFMSLSYRF